MKIAITTATILLVAAATTTSLEVVYAQLTGATGALQQQQQNQQPPTPQSSSSLFESPEKGIRVQVPTGYVVEDPEPVVINPETEQLLNQAGLNLIVPQFLLHVCPEELSLPAIGGQHICENPPGMVFAPREGAGTIGTADAIHVMRFDNLRDYPEFERVVRQNQNISVDDLIPFNIIFLTQATFVWDVELDVVNTTDTTVNYYAEGAQVPRALPAKLADFVYTIRWDDGISGGGSMEYRGFFLHVLSPDGNSGYILGYEQPSSEVIESAGGGGEAGVVQQQQQWISPAVAQVFNSFELVE
jgi:hypothetical protein